MIEIKNFGNDLGVACAEELQEALANQYSGKHVSIRYKTLPHGMHRLLHVSVSDNGDITETHSGKPVDFGAIAARLMQET